ncbi:MAG TPA: hypothetical protein VN042_08175 [Asticcacaulis sp.]|nr:hypothetical protein [Asticcacaulis sp.]
MSLSRRHLLLLAPLMLAAPAHAGEDKKNAAAPSVQLASVGIPVMKDNRLVNYLFLSIKVNLTGKANEAKLRDMEPYFRDAIVRLASQTSFAQADNEDVLDIPRFSAAVIPEFEKFAGPGTIKSLDILAQNPKIHHRH